MAFGDIKRPVAAKHHTCTWCCGPIPQGEKHVLFVGQRQNEFQNWRMHEECYTDAADGDYLTEGFMDGDGEMPERIKAIVAEEKAMKLKA
jgi:hypothetical protein